MTAHLWHSGCPANKVGGAGSKGPDVEESTIFPSGFIGDTKYQFQTNDAILERLGYCEHKGLGGWMHSHIPTVLSAVLTGEPYQPKVWIERSGNKMAALGNSSSWVDAFPKVRPHRARLYVPDQLHHRAADIVFPVCEWLENAFVQNRLNVNLMRKPVTNLFEAADEIVMWGKIAEAMSDPSSDLYDEEHGRLHGRRENRQPHGARVLEDHQRVLGLGCSAGRRRRSPRWSRPWTPSPRSGPKTTSTGAAPVRRLLQGQRQRRRGRQG